MSTEYDDQKHEQAYIDLVWRLGEGEIDPSNSLDRVNLILAAAGKLPYELERDVCDYVKARDEREWLESIFDGHVKARADGWPISPRHDFPGLLEAMGKTEDDFFMAVLSLKIQNEQGY